MRVATLLMFALGCAPSALSITDDHPASPNAPAGRLAQSPNAFEQIETPAPPPSPTPPARPRPPENVAAEPTKPAKPTPTKPAPKKPEPKKPEPKKPDPKDPHHGHEGHH